MMPRALLAIALAALPLPAATLTSARLGATIRDENGVVAALVDRSDGLALLGLSPDHYALQPTPETRVMATELDDRLVSQDRDGAVYRNERLPDILIRKRYTVTARWLEKRVEFSSGVRDAGLLLHTIGSQPDPAFYRDGYLNDPSRHPLDYPYLPISTLTGERPMRDSHAVADHHWAIFTNPQLGRGLAQYRFAVDDRYVHPLSSYSQEPGLVYTPTGWRVATACKWISSDRPTLVVTSRWQVFDGDHLRFHQDYLALPEVRAAYDFESPAWLQEVKAVASWGYGGSGFRMDRFRDQVEALDGGILMVMIGQVFTNTRRYLADLFFNADGVEVEAARLEQVVRDLHAVSPRIKVGPMTWQWAFGEADPVYREHPEWTVHGPDGQPAFAATGWADEKVYSQLLTPACRAYVLEQFEGLQRRYDFDFIYMDTGQGGVTRFDWTTRWGAQDYDWADLYRGIRDAARSNRGGPTFFNGTPQLYSQFADCGYFEGVGFVKVRDWRAMADRLLLVKLYQPGDKWTIPLYWRDDNQDEYINQCYLLALRPGDFAGSHSTRRWPLVQAALELAPARLALDAEARPCWWKEATEAEVYALRMPGGGLLNIRQHAAAGGRVTASCLLQPLGLDPGKPVQAWLFRPQPAAATIDAVRLTEFDANEVYRREGQAPYRVMGTTYLGPQQARDGRVEVTVELPAEQVALILLTQAERLAYEVDRRPTQLLLPATATATGTLPADQPVPAALVASRASHALADGPISAILVPDRSTPETVNRVEQAVGRNVAGLQLLRTITIDCEHNRADAATATVGPDRVKLVAEMGDDKLYGFASAGVEAANAGRLTLRVALPPPMFKRYATSATASFVGLVADYHTAAGYRRRVRFSLAGIRAEALTITRPWWGVFDDTRAAPSEPLFVDWQGKVAVGGEAEVTLDLGAYAPEGWDGQVLFGPVLESCGLGSRVEIDILANAAAGPREPASFSKLPVVQQQDGSVLYQGAQIARFESGARLDGQQVVFPPEGLVEGSGFRVITWHVARAAESQVATLMINYQRQDGSYLLVYRDLGEYVKPGSETRFDLDLGQWAPEDWNGRVRMRLRGDGVAAELVANSSFQVF